MTKINVYLQERIEAPVRKINKRVKPYKTIFWIIGMIVYTGFHAKQTLGF